jgi:hypothetical protein
MRSVVTLSISALALAAPAGAQDQAALEQRAVLEAKLQVERARVGVETRVTKGAPYSAEAVTETLQVLADGNRISRRSTTRIYRDSEGRTRRETLSPTGDVVSINISDPVAQTSFVLDPRTKVAQRSGVVMMTDARAGFVSVESPTGSVRRYAVTPGTEVTEAEMRARREVEAAAAAAAGAGAGRGAGSGGGAVAGARGGGGAAPTVAAVAMAAGSNVSKEELGSQIVEGVTATGTRSTTTIDAGAIGNLQPIHVVSEQWYSDDLKVLVRTRHEDPRTGTTTYRLTNIVPSEPARTLFEIPADYTVKESVTRRDNPLK